MKTIKRKKEIQKSRPLRSSTHTKTNPKRTSISKKPAILLIGLGSQGQAWAQNLKRSGWEVHCLLRKESKRQKIAKKLNLQLHFFVKSKSTFGRAKAPLANTVGGVNSSTTSDTPPSLTLPDKLINLLHPAMPIAFLCPDLEIGPLYQSAFATIEKTLHLVLAHGYAAYSGAIHVSPTHHWHLLAPKAIGPKLEEQHRIHFPKPHALVAGVGGFAAEQRPTTKPVPPLIRALAQGLGFHSKNLVPTCLEQEAIGDLISEQGLLCGPIFTFLEWTIQAMQQAGIPKRLIQEECLSELELIAGLLKARGPSQTLSAISQAALCGSVLFRDRLVKSGVEKEFQQMTTEVLNQTFARRFESENAWKTQAKTWTDNFKQWEKTK